MTPVEIQKGNGPIVLGFPHTGTWLPAEVEQNLTARGKTLSDTDWHIHTLYDGLLDDVTTVRATFHRYVIDANRDPSGGSLYPGQNTTGLVPTGDFDDRPIWLSEPDTAQIEARRIAFHQAYHAALNAELERVKSIHGIAILYDCHSIRSLIPHLFEGVLPDLNIGSNDGTTCHQLVQAAVADTCNAQTKYSTILNGRFKGGWTTRHYGKPDNGIHAIQMELAQSTHLKNENETWEYDPDKAAHLRPVLKEILTTLAALAPQLRAEVVLQNWTAC